MYSIGMEFREQIVCGLEQALMEALPYTDKENCFLQVRCDHGHWEIVVRDHGNKKKMECTLADHRTDSDTVWINHYEAQAAGIYWGGVANSSREDCLSDPGFFDRLVA